MTASLLKTACHDWHTSHNGRMVDFAGWEMPVQYTTIVEEHQAVRRAAGLFDIGHMGRIQFTGPDAVRLLDHLVTNDVTRLEPGQICYALVTNADGGVLDDVLVYRLPDMHLLVVNASNRGKILAWIAEHRGPFDVQVEDLTFSHFMLALQGPRAEQILQPHLDLDLAQLSYYYGAHTRVSGELGIVSRTGYTGEDGFEVILPAARSPQFWNLLIESGRAAGLLPAGLACRDTLRLEAAMPLYGHELTEATNPFEAGLGFAVKLDDGDFIGREALIAAKAHPRYPRRIGLELSGRRIAREGAEVYAGGERVGRVTSGTFSPTLEKSIAMAYVAPECAIIGTSLEVDIRGKRETATVMKLPFYKRRRADRR